MKKIAATISCLSILIYGFSQSPRPVIGKPDTSYTLYSAAASLSKTNPDAKIVNELHSLSIAEEKNIRYCNAGNRQLLIDAFFPKQRATAKGIAIVIIHGGGWRAGNRTLHYPLAQRLAAMGYVCFT